MQGTELASSLVGEVVPIQNTPHGSFGLTRVIRKPESHELGSDGCLRVAYEIASGPLASTIISEIYDRLLPFVRLYKKISDLPIV